jgi:hypothetical protein
MVQLIFSFLVLILSVFNGIRLFVDGIVVYLTGNSFPFNDYWWYIVKAFDIPFDLFGLVIMGFGFLWLGASTLYFFRKISGRVFIMFLSLFTLWNVLWGAVISLLIFGLNFFTGNRRMLELWHEFRHKHLNKDQNRSSSEEQTITESAEKHDKTRHPIREYDWWKSEDSE